MLRPRVATHASKAASSLSSLSSLSSSSAEGGEIWSPTIANPRLSAFDRLKEEHISSSEVGKSDDDGEFEEAQRGVSAGPLDLQDLMLLNELVDDRGSGDSTEPQDREYEEEEDDDEDALKALFFRQQQLEKKLLHSREQEPEEQGQHDDVDQFLTSELHFDIPTASASDKSTVLKKKNTRKASRSIKSSSQRETMGPSMSALTASMHKQLSVEGSHRHHQRRSRRQSNALLPDGVLHLWIYQARQLSFRSHFESMYDRHGLHIRCYLSWRHEYLSDVFESRRNVGGNMKNPIWRRDDDNSRNLMRGHFSIPLGSRSSPASLPANTELVIEIVCGILAVSTAKVSLLEFFQDRSSKSSTEDDDYDYDDNDLANASGNRSGIVSCSPEWYPLIGQDSGLLEMGLEFVPASAFDDDDDEEEPDDLAFAPVENNNENEYEDELAVLDDDDSNLYQDGGEETEPQVQDPSEPNAFEEEYMQLEQRTLTRKMRFECPELREQFEALEAQHAEGSDSEQYTTSGGGVVVSNNGKTTMYIPSQCQSNQERSVGFPVSQSSDRQLSTNSPSTSLVTTRTDLAQTSSPSTPRSDEVMMDEQVFDLFRFGIANDQTNLPNGMHRTSSCVSQISQFSWGNFEYSRSDASMFSRKASTCATEVLAYNELIQDMESSLEAEAAEEAQRDGNRRRRRTSTLNSSSSTAIPKVDGILRLAAPTSEPHPITAAMGVIPNKSSLKKSSFMRTYDASKGESNSLEDDYHQASSVREQTPKGVVLFDLKSIPERLRVGFERSVSEERMTGNKKDVNLGRRRSLPVNSLTAPNASQPPMSLHAAHNRGPRNGGRSSRPVVIEEHNDERINNDASQEHILRRKRSSSMHSLTDLHGRRDEASPSNVNGIQRQQQQQHRGSHVSARRDRSSTPRPAGQRRNSNNSNLVNVGGAVLGVGKFINVGSVPGVVRYVGPVNFASGTWIGIELCEKKGKNNGTVKGIEYFSCAPDHGIFIRANRLDITT